MAGPYQCNETGSMTQPQVFRNVGKRLIIAMVIEE
jgi:hypothetical protein